jgi:3-oxoacyl-[acyl-carrier-protein] synthase III
MITIVSVGTSVPDFLVTNDYVVSLAVEQSRRFYKGETSRLESSIRQFLQRTGAKRRRWRAGFTKPIEHIADAWCNCLSKADKREILQQLGGLIYCGIDKGLIEPPHASLLAQKFGLKDVRTLDISDACMGWFTATQVAAGIVTEERPYCAIVSAEFPIEVPGKVYPDSFQIRNDDDLIWKGAALTLGECASVTIIRQAPRDRGQFTFKSNHEFADICGVPLARPDRFVDPGPLLDKFKDNCFVANMVKMASVGYRDAQDVLREYISLFGVPDIVLPHTVSQTMPLHIAGSLLREGSLMNCFVDFGNIATCSIPVGYEYFGCHSRRGEHIVGWVAAAGMSHCVARIH